MITVNSKIVGQKQFLDKLKRLEHLNYSDIGEIVRAKMINIINESRVTNVKQPEERYQGKYTAHLEDSIQVEFKPNGIVIGNKAVMQEMTPYWRVVNDGGYVPTPVHGAFTGGPGSTFAYSADAPLMTPASPLPAMRYIEKTGAWMKQHLKRFIKDKLIKQMKNKPGTREKDARGTALFKVNSK